MTPVEERIDHKEALRKLSELRRIEQGTQCFDAESQRMTSQRIRDLSEIERAYKQLLTEHSAREEREQEFLDASVAVWREIDAMTTRDGYYQGLDAGTALRIREREAWEAYKTALPATESAQPEEER